MSSIPVSTTASLVTPIPDSKIADDCHDGMATPPTAAFNAAKQSLGLPGHSPAQALLVNQSPQLNGQIIDELVGHEGGVLGGRASTFAEGENFTTTRVHADGTTILSAFIWYKTGTNNPGGCHGSYGTDDNWLMWTSSGKWNFLVSSDGGTTQKRYEYLVPGTLGDDQWHNVGMVFAGSVLTLFYDGQEVTKTGTVNDDAMSTISSADDFYEIGAYNNGGTPSSFWPGQLQWPIVDDSYAWTAADVANYFNDGTLPSTPSFLGYLIDDKCYDLTGNQSTITGTATLAEYNDKDVPPAPYELDRAGWSADRQGRLTITPTDGDVFVFKVKTTDEDFIIMSGNDPGTEYEVIWSDGSGSSATQYGPSLLTVDGVDFSSASRNDLYVAVADDVEHTIEITMVDYNTDWVYVEWGLYGGGVGAFGGLSNGYCRLVEINGEKLKLSDIDLDETDIIPKLLDSSSDAAGGTRSAPVLYSGQAKDHGVMSNGPCVECHGAEFSDIGHSADLSFGDGVTDSPFSLSLKADLNQLTTQGLISKYQGASNAEWGVSVQGGVLYFYLMDATHSHLLGRSVSFSTFVQDLLLTYDGSGVNTGMKVYFDGVEIATASSDTGSYVAMEVDASTEVELGRYGGSIYTDGKLWDVRIYDQVVTPTQVDDLSIDPIRHWPCQERTGLTSYDVSGNDNHATWTSTITRPNAATGYFWNQAKGCDSVGIFDGTDDYILLDSVISLTGDFTLLGWYYPEINTSQALFANANGEWVRHDGGDFDIKISTQTSVTTSPGLPQNTWTHIAVVRDGSDVTMYFDGVSAGSLTKTGTMKVLQICAKNVGGGTENFFDGDAYGFEIHDRAFSAADLTASVAGTPSDLSNCLCKLDLDDVSGLTVLDSSGNGNNGTIKNTTSDEFWKLLPANADGTSQIVGSPNNPAGPYLIDDGTVINHLSDETATWLDNLWQGHAEFDGTLADGIESTSNVSSYPFTISCDVKLKSTSASNLYLAYVNQSGTQYLGFRVKSGELWIQRRNTTNYEMTTSLAMVQDVWYSVEVVFENETTVTATVNGQSSTVAGDSVSIITAIELFIGQERDTYARSPDFDIKNVVVTEGTTVRNNMPLSKNALCTVTGTGTNTGATFPKLYDGSDLIGASFDGSTSYISLGDDDSFSFGDASTDVPFSVEATIKVDSFGTGKGGVINKFTDTTAGNLEWSLVFGDGGELVFQLFDNDGSNSIKMQLDSGLSTGTEYNILATYDGSGLNTGINIWVDGSQPAQTAGSSGTYVAMHATATPVEIGVYAIDNAGSRYMDGTIKDVRIYNTECTPTSKAGLIFDLPLLENSTDIINGNDGTDTAVTYSTYNVTNHQYDDAKASPQSQINNSKIISLEN